MHKQENEEREIEKKMERIEIGNFKNPKCLKTLNKKILFALGVTKSVWGLPDH